MSLIQRAAASAVCAGSVLKAMDARGAAVRMMLTTLSNSNKFLAGSLNPVPMTTHLLICAEN